MNIIEAARSGKPFKRRHWEYTWQDGYVRGLRNGIEDFLADDWEIEEKRVTISESEFDKAWFKVTRGLYYRDDFKKELGF